MFQILKIFTLCYIICLYVHEYECRCSQRIEKGAGTPEARGTVNCMPPDSESNSGLLQEQCVFFSPNRITQDSS